MTVPNSRIDIRVSNPEKDQWQQAADALGITMTQLIKMSVRLQVQQARTNFFTASSGVTINSGNSTSGSTAYIGTQHPDE